MPPVSEERLAELTDRLESGIKDLYASGRYADYLAAMSKFHSYSYRYNLKSRWTRPLCSTCSMRPRRRNRQWK